MSTRVAVIGGGRDDAAETAGSTVQSHVPSMYAADGVDLPGLLAELVSAAVVTYRARTWDRHRLIAT